jgi:hypothetical protein
VGPDDGGEDGHDPAGVTEEATAAGGGDGRDRRQR